MRLLFLLLLLLNTAFFVWQYRLQETTQATHLEPMAAAGQDLLLLSERKTERKQRSAEHLHTALPLEKKTSRENSICYRVGPFDTPVQAAVFGRDPAWRSTAHKVREEKEQQLGSYWLKWADTLTIKDARRLLKRLQSQGVRDIAITPLGNHRYTISLGVFKQYATLVQRQQALTALGFRPVVSKRYRMISRFWLGFVGRGPSVNKLGALLTGKAGQFPGVTVKRITCGDLLIGSG